MQTQSEEVRGTCSKCKDSIYSDQTLITLYKNGEVEGYLCEVCYERENDLAYVEGERRGVIGTHLLLRASLHGARRYQDSVAYEHDLERLNAGRLEIGNRVLVGWATEKPSVFQLVNWETKMKAWTREEQGRLFWAPCDERLLSPIGARCECCCLEGSKPSSASEDRHLRAKVDFAVKVSEERISSFLKKVFEPQIWLGREGLQEWLAKESQRGHRCALPSGTVVMTYVIAGRCMVTLNLRGDENRFISFLAAEDADYPTMGIQGMRLTEGEALGLMREVVAAKWAGDLKMEVESEVRIAGT